MPKSENFSVNFNSQLFTHPLIFFSSRKRRKQSLTDPWISILSWLPKLFNGFPCLSSMKTYFRINAAEHKSCIKPLYEGTKGGKAWKKRMMKIKKCIFFKTIKKESELLCVEAERVIFPSNFHFHPFFYYLIGAGGATHYLFFYLFM